MKLLVFPRMKHNYTTFISMLFVRKEVTLIRYREHYGHIFRETETIRMFVHANTTYLEPFVT